MSIAEVVHYTLIDAVAEGTEGLEVASEARLTNFVMVIIICSLSFLLAFFACLRERLTGICLIPIDVQMCTRTT